jgi:hypothetical protein
LVAAFEDISIKESLKKLSVGLDIKIDDVIDSLVKDISIYINSEDDDEKSESLCANSLFVSVHMYNFLQKVNFDKNELEIAEKVFKLTDDLIYVENLEDLLKLSKKLPANTKNRYNSFMENKKNDEIKKLKSLHSVD